MLKIKLINEQATLNNFFHLESKEYTPGTSLKVLFQILDHETGIRLIPGASGTCKLKFQKSDGTELEKDATLVFGNDDRSCWKVSLSQTETNEIIGSNFLVTLDMDGASTDVKVGMAYNAIAKVTFSGE